MKHSLQPRRFLLSAALPRLSAEHEFILRFIRTTRFYTGLSRRVSPREAFRERGPSNVSEERRGGEDVERRPTVLEKNRARMRRARAKSSA